MSNLNIIGLMSGTSLDGLDICYANFKHENEQWMVSRLVTKEVPYNGVWRQELNDAFYLSKKELQLLSVKFAKYMAKQVNDFIIEHKLNGKVDVIASHGQTIFHEPSKGITVQIGDGKTLADKVGVQVVNDFRIKDVLLGGQGAPLVPIGDLYLFGKYEACLNLGGIANISFDKNGERIAFDICPANLPLNRLMLEHFNKDYDKNGELASSGSVNKILLDRLNNLPYYQADSPKSLAVEWLNAHFYPIILHPDYRGMSVADFLATIIVHEAQQIAQVLNYEKLKNVLVTGGGAFNSYFIDTLQKHTSCQVTLPNDQIISFKEALIFGFLAALKLNNQINTLKSVTGASKDSVGGRLHHPSSV